MFYTCVTLNSFIPVLSGEGTRAAPSRRNHTPSTGALYVVFQGGNHPLVNYRESRGMAATPDAAAQCDRVPLSLPLTLCPHQPTLHHHGSFLLTGIAAGTNQSPGAFSCLPFFLSLGFDACAPDPRFLNQTGFVGVPRIKTTGLQNGLGWKGPLEVI